MTFSHMSAEPAERGDDSLTYLLRTVQYSTRTKFQSSKTLLAREFSTNIKKQAIQCLCKQDVLGQPPETVSKINVQVQM